MSVPAAFLAIILVWSTTPLAVKWSSEGAGFLLGALSRMALAAILCVAILTALRRKLPWHRQARQAYIAAALGAYGALLCVYWGAQYIPSGIVALVFGLTPLLTALFARIVLNERSLTSPKLAGMLLALLGLGVIFGAHATWGAHAAAGILVVLLGVVLHSLAAVLVKRHNASLPSFMLTTGALLITAPLFFLTWEIFGAPIPAAVTPQTVGAIVYLGIVGSVIGFSLYFYLLRHIEANAVALVTLVSPVLALILGATVNHESIPGRVWTGAALVLLGMALHHWGHILLRGLVAQERAPRNR